MNTKTKTKYFSTSILVFLYSFLFPTISFAAGGSLKDLLSAFGGVVTSLIPMAFGLAVLFFFYGIAKFILSAGSAEGRAEGKSIMVWGVIALFVMVSVWGIVKFIGDQLNIKPLNINNSNSSVTYPSN